MKLSVIVIVLTLILSTFVSVLIHSLNLLPPRPQIRWTFGILYALLFLSIFIGIFLEHKLGIGLAKVITFSGYTFLLVVMMMLVSYLLVDLLRLANHIFHFTLPGMLQARQWAAIGSMLIITVVLGIGNYRFNHPKIVTIEQEVAKSTLKKELRIVAASDIHLGTSIDKKRLHSYIQLINSQHPDIILLAGDIVDRSFGSVMEQRMEEELRQLSAPLGVFAISGNHEFYSGVRNQIFDYLSKAGIHVLCDTSVLVDNRFYLIGREDRTNIHRKPLSDLVAGLKPEYPRILLDHQPHHLEEACKNDIDLQISGHTHNGQFFPGNLIVKSIFEDAYGYLKKGKTSFYVSSGLGIWGPQYRIGSQSEIVVIRLKPV
jgi:uncharacterized protein